MEFREAFAERTKCKESPRRPHSGLNGPLSACASVRAHEDSGPIAITGFTLLLRSRSLAESERTGMIKPGEVETQQSKPNDQIDRSRNGSGKVHAIR